MIIEDLISQCVKNDRKAQQQLYELYKGRLFSICLKYCRSTPEAEDHLHDVFVEIFTHIKTYKGSGSFEGWMKRITINKAIKKFKKNTAFPPKRPNPKMV